MSQPLRMFEPDRIYFVTNRTMQGRLLMRPSKDINNTIGGILAKGQQKYNIEIFAFVFTSNHFHLMLRAPEGQLSDFLMYIESNIARKVGKKVDWHGKFWERRFSAEPVLDDDAMINRMIYVFSHGVKEGLVASPKEWPGLTCFAEAIEGVKRYFPWHNWSALSKARKKRQRVTRDHFVEFHSIKINPIPHLKHLDVKEYRKRLKKILEQAHAYGQERHGTKYFLGKQTILEQHPHSRPKTVKRSSRPLCHATCPVLRQTFRETYKAFHNAYKEASAAFRSGQWDTEFPLYSFKPPVPYHLLTPNPI